MSQSPSNISQKLQPVLLAVVAPLVLALLGWLYMGHIHTLQLQEVHRSLDYAAGQGASIIDARLEGRLLALSTMASHPRLKDPSVSVQHKLELIAPEASRRGLVRFGLATLQGEAHTTDGYATSVRDRKYFTEARYGSAHISSVMVCKLDGKNIVVHAVPVRNEQGDVIAVLFGVEKAADLAGMLNIRFNYGDMGAALIMDENGMLLDGQSFDKDNFFRQLAAENSPEALSLFRRQLHQPQAALEVYSHKGAPVYFRSARVGGASGWTLLLLVPEEGAAGTLKPLLNLTLGALFVIALLLFGCGMYIMALRRGYVQQRGFTAAAIHAAGIYQLEVDAAGRMLSCNALFRRRMGWGEYDELPYIQDLGAENLRQDTENALQRGELFAQKLRAPGGDVVHVQWHVLPGRHSEEHVLLGTDFSEREQAAEQQRVMAAMRDMQNIFDNIPFPMALRNVDNSLRLANRSLVELVGKEGLLQTQRFGGKTPDTEVAELDAAFARVVSSRASVSVSHSAQHQDGSVHHYENTQTPLLDEFGEVSGVVSISVDVTDSLRVQEHLALEVQRLRELLDSSPVGVVIVVKGIVRFRNLRARQMVGAEVGGNVWDVPLMEGDPRQVLEQLEHRSIVRDVPFTLIDPQRRTRHLLLTVSRTQLEGELGTLIWAVDVTAIKDVESQLIQARDVAEAATRAKSDFLATMSHEIRTPMNAVLGFVHLFERGNLTERQGNYLEKISISASGLLRIINDILDFSKIEAGKLEMEHTPFLLSACVNATHSIMSFSAREKGLELFTHVADNVPEVICGDRQRLNQVLINLLSNAVKFTEMGSVRLDVELREQCDDGFVVLGFRVSDTGIGMNEAQISRIFQPFTQADASTSRKFGGTGLGLVISRRLVQLMGGTIEVDSTSDQGTAFSFTIRVQPGTQADVPRPSMALDNVDSDMETLRGQCILVAEDNEINQEIAGAMLEVWGLVVDFANDGQEAVDKALSHDYALIFMDMQMPGMDGLQATRSIRALGEQKPSLRTLPIVAMTANAMLNDRRRCLEAGMNDHLGKPIDPAQLRRLLLQWIKL